MATSPADTPARAEPGARPAPPPAAIEFARVTKRYPGGETGLDDVSLTVTRGEFVFVVGSTGSGKSTLMRLLIKELEPSSGTIRVAGRSLAEITRKKIPYYRRNLVATRVVKLTTGLLAVLLVVASVLLVSNTIRLSLFSRRREVEVMKLVGATDWFIRWPFVLEGLFVGALGGAGAVALLALAKVTLVDPLANAVRLVAAPNTIQFGLLVAVLVSASVAVSAVGSSLSLRRFL